MIENDKQLEQRLLELTTHKIPLLDIYHTLYREIDTTTSYNTIESNFTGYFVYLAIKHQSDLHEFSTLMHHLYQTVTVENLGSHLNNFFYSRDANISLKAYTKLDKYNNDKSIYDNTRYVFLDMDASAPVDKKVILDKKTLPYLLAMLNEVDENTVGTIWYAGYRSFLQDFLHNIKEIKPLIEMALHHPALQTSKPGEYGSFFDVLLRDLGRYTHEQLYAGESRDMYRALVKIVPNIDEFIATSLFRREGGGDDANKISLEVLNFCGCADPLVDTIGIINTHYQHLYAQHLSNLSGSLYEDLRNYNKIASDITNTTSIVYAKFDFTLDVSKIDSSKPFQDNYIYLKMIETKLQKNRTVEMSQDVAQYIHNLFNNDKDDSFENQMFGLKSMLDETTFMTYLKPYMMYKELDNSLQTNACASGKRPKV